MVGFFKIHHFHRSIAEKAFSWFISLLLTDSYYKPTRLYPSAYYCVSIHPQRRLFA